MDVLEKDVFSWEVSVSEPFFVQILQSSDKIEGTCNYLAEVESGLGLGERASYGDILEEFIFL